MESVEGRSLKGAVLEFLKALAKGAFDYDYRLQITITDYDYRLCLQITFTDYVYRLRYQITITGLNQYQSLSSESLPHFDIYNLFVALKLRK